MLKFIHTGDIRLGVLPDPGMPWRAERAAAITRTFRRILETAEDRGVTLVFIAGDLFFSQPLKRDLEMVNGLFAAHPSLRIFLTAGALDHIRDNSASRSFTWSKNVTFFDRDMTVRPEGAGYSVTGISLDSGVLPEDLSARIPSDEGDKAPIRFLLAPAGEGSLEGEAGEKLLDAGFTYCALGSLPNKKTGGSRAVSWCGSPEPSSPAETGSHGVWYGEVDETDGTLSRLDFLSLASARYITLSFGVTPETTGTELLKTISAEAAARGSENIYRFRITGKRAPETSFDLSPLSGRFRVLEVIDETEPDYDLSALFAAHPGDMIGFFIRAFDKPDLSPMEQEAKIRGIRALLAAREEK